MRMPVVYRPELCVSKDKTRAALTYLYLDTEAATLSATDGYMAIAVPVTIEPGDITGLIPVEALKLARKAAGKRMLELAIGCSEVIRVTYDASHTEFLRPDSSLVFPPLDRMVQTTRTDLGNAKTHTFALNPQLLVSLADAAGGGIVEITVNTEDSFCAISIAPQDAPKSDAVLMPCRVEKANVFAERAAEKAKREFEKEAKRQAKARAKEEREAAREAKARLKAEKMAQKAAA